MEGIVVTDPVPVVEELEIPSDATTGLGPAKLTVFNSSGGGDGSLASRPWSLTHEQQVFNFKRNWRTAFNWPLGSGKWIAIESKIPTSPWFAKVVLQLQDDDCLDTHEFVFDHSLLGGELSGVKMTSLNAAIMMGDLKMVQKIFERSSVLADKLLRSSLVDTQRVERVRNFTNTELAMIYTPLHLAVVGEYKHIVDELLEKGADVNANSLLGLSPLDLTCKMKNVDILQQLLAKDEDKKRDPLHVAVQYGDVNFLKKLTSPNVNAKDIRGKTPLHYLAATQSLKADVITNIVQYLSDQDNALDMKALDYYYCSAFYLAILCCNTQLVITLLESFKDQIQLNEICDGGLGPPIQIAFEGGDNYEDIQSALMECEPIKGYMDKLYRDRQVYVDAANAILVGAALIASVTFASWLQPPLNYTSYFGAGYTSSDSTPSTSNLNYVDVEHNIALRAFWVFNALSFYFAIATVVCGARSVLPRSHLFIKKTVEKLRTNLLATSILLACSVLFVIIAFAIAGTIVLTPLLKYQWCMIVPTLVGGMVCIISLVFLVRNMREIYSNRRENSENLFIIRKIHLKHFI